MTTRKPVVSFTVPTVPITNPDGSPNWTWVKWFQGVQQTINAAFDQQGNFDGSLGVDTFLVGRPATTLAIILGNISDLGLVLGPGIDFAQPYTNKDTDHIADGTGHPLAGGKVAYAALVLSGPAAGQILGFNGVDWVPVAGPQTIAPPFNQWLKSYSAATGLFTSAQLAYGDLSGLPLLPNTIAPVAGEYLTGYDASTGNFSQSTPAGISATIVTAALTGGGTQGSMTFVDGILTAQVPAT